MDVIEFHPDQDEYAFTFGGVAPVRKVQPGTMLRLWTDDAFCGNLRDPADMPSAKRRCRSWSTPQTGPFCVEGAEPGDTLALHFVELSPARDWGASSTIPLFGGLTGTDRTATLQDPLEERTWIYEADQDRRTVVFQARANDLQLELPMDPMLGTVGVAPANAAVRSSLVPDAFGGRHGHPRGARWRQLLRRGSTCRARCSPSATATLPAGRGRVVRDGDGGRDGRLAHRGPGQGRSAGLAADRDGRLPDGVGVGKPAGGRLANQPGRHSRLAEQPAAGWTGSTPTSSSPRSVSVR